MHASLRIFLIVGWTFGAALSAAPRKVVIDQDAYGPGGSNQQAILLVLQSPDVEVLGITVESGDGWREENVAHTLRMLELIGRPEVPVFRGATHPLLNSKAATERWEARHGKLFYKGAWTESWPDTGVRRAPYHPPEVVPPMREGAPGVAMKARPESAVEFLLRVTREHPGEVSILAMGPLTNLALAARLDDEFAARVRELVIMGGSFNPRPADNAFAGEYAHTVRLEFNFRWDPEAARIVLRSAWPRVVLLPIDPTTATFFKPDLFRRIAAADTPVSRYVTTWSEGYPMWDELAAAALLRPDLMTERRVMAVDVDTSHDTAGYGHTLSWPAGHGPGLGERDIEVVFAADVPRFEEWCVETLSAP
ncbi:MAG: nucleoside hydrolase [Burkholderiales bacterium]|nr:nucleoside hydrolase [Opitutaceae bacterium]